MTKKKLILSIFVAVALLIIFLFTSYYIINYSQTESEYLNDEYYCKQNSDCVRDCIYRPEKCVNRYYAKLNQKSADHVFLGDVCLPCISSCECIDNKCKTNYTEFHEDGVSCC